MNRLSLSVLGLVMAIAGLTGCTKKVKKTDDKKVFLHLRTSAERSLDPMAQFDAASAQLVQNLYDTLLDYHYLKRPYELEPNLLSEMPIQQSDKVTYFLKLRKGIYFHDNKAFPGGKGREMNADDVIYSIKRFADINVNKLSYILIRGYVEGMDEFREKTKELGDKVDYTKLDISGVKKVDDYTVSVKFTFDNPLAFFPFAFKGMSIVPREAVETYGLDFSKNPVGTGPFYMKQYSRRGTHILAKNTKYHLRYPIEGTQGDQEAGLLVDAGKQIPFVDEIHLPLIEETQPAMLKFKKGQLHLISVNKDEFNNMAFKNKDGTYKLQKEWEGKLNLFHSPRLGTSYMKFNMNDKVVGSNKALRQAMAYAMDREGYINLMFNGRGEPSNSFVPLTIAGDAKDTSSLWYPYDTEMAKKKLAEAGFPDGKGAPVITVEYRATTKDARQQFEFFRAGWENIGLTVKANFQTFSSFLKRTEAGNYQVADALWLADYPDAENFYQLLFSENKAPGPNDGNYTNPKYDELFKKIRYMKNSPERMALFKDLNDIIQDEVPVLLIFQPLSFGLYQNNVRNFKRHLLNEHPYKYFQLKQ